MVTEKTSNHQLLLEIVTPVRRVFAEHVSSVVMPGHDGYFGVLPRHTPLLAALRVGDIKVVRSGQVLHFATSGGVVEVLPERIRVLAETAEGAAEIDVARAEAASTRAQKRFAEGGKRWDVVRAQAALARAINRLRIARLRM